MGWVRLDDRITEHPKIAAAGPLGLAVYVAALAYCNRNLTDGFIPRNVASTLLSDEWVDFEGTVWTAAATSGHQGWDFDCIEIAEHLVDVGLFHKVERHAVSHSAGYTIHDYEDYQPLRVDVLAKREKDAERQFRHREKRAVSRGKSNGVTNAVSHTPVTDAPTPTPTVVLSTSTPNTKQRDVA